MRENRQYGSEGGGAELNRFSLPLSRYQLAGSHGQRLRNFEIRVTSLRRRPSPPPPLSLSRPHDTIVSEPLRSVGLTIADLRVFG